MFSIYDLLQKFRPGGNTQIASAFLKEDRLIREEKAAKAEIDELLEDFYRSNYSDRVNSMKDLVKAIKDYANAGLLHADASLLDPVSGRPQGHYLIPIFRDLLKNDKDPEIRILAVTGLDHLRNLGNIAPILDETLAHEGNKNVIAAIEQVFFIRNMRDPVLDNRLGI